MTDHCQRYRRALQQPTSYNCLDDMEFVQCVDANKDEMFAYMDEEFTKRRPPAKEQQQQPQQHKRNVLTQQSQTDGTGIGRNPNNTEKRPQRDDSLIRRKKKKKERTRKKNTNPTMKRKTNKKNLEMMQEPS